MSEMIKVHVSFADGSGESLWATQINETTAKIDNIPFLCDEISLGDLVEIDSEREYVRIIEKTANTHHIKYEKDGDIKETYGKIRDHLSKFDIHMEGMFPGMASISVPKDIQKTRLKEICEETNAELY